MADTLIKSEPTLKQTPEGNGAAVPKSESRAATESAAVPQMHKRKWLWIIGLLAAVGAGVYIVPWAGEMMNTVSTDDAYVNGDVTYVAPRVGGQVARVLVHENNVVHKGDLLLELDLEPYQVQVNVAQAAVASAKADLVAADASVHGSAGLARSLVFGLQRAMDDVKDKVALLKLRVATLESKKASLAKAEADYNRNKPLVATGVVTQQDMDAYTESYLVARAQVQEALQSVYETRVALGLSATPASGNDLSEVPAGLEQTFSAVREAQGKLIQSASALGVSGSFEKLPREMMADFYSRYPKQNIDQIFDKLFKDAPAVKQAQAKLLQAEKNLADAELNLRYCKIYAEIDGAVTRKNVNPGNNVVAGQSLMALRSINEIWIDANFKETQLAKLRIGQPVKIETDMYGKHQEFKGRITGFTMGTGQTLSLLPPQNATGNFVKIVQRLPVRIDLIDYDAEKAPLFVGLSVEPKVYFKQEPSGLNAGKFLQAALP
jgi:membrane fusion protein (multidrug efflux system)